MPFGYSNRFVTEVNARYAQAPHDAVVELCYLCVQNDIMLSEAAERLDVSKQTIYNWFAGEYKPKPDALKRIETLNKKLKKQAARV